MDIIIALLLFVFFSMILAVLCFRMRKKPSMLNGVKQKWADTASMVPPKKITTPPTKGTRDRSTPKLHDDFMKAMMGLNCADKPGNVFWDAFNRRRDDD
ncbi:hypothetical protein [Geomonas subterranea]|uniref:hypothetical protein n=1 Tax=Geomonas subterranea TaxID=2847989 RepID=UPI001CD4ACA5|nr:hypothetical protein [Geomonas fuzhouensis]